MSPAGRTSGEYPVPVTQEQFGGFASEVRGFMQEQRTQNGVIMSLLSEGQATMAVLRSDSAMNLRRADDASSKINLLRQQEAVRTERERHEETQTLPVLSMLPAPPTFWQKATDELSKKFISALAVVVLIVVYQEVRSFMIAHPSLAADGEGFTLPAKEHHGDRATNQASIPPSIPTGYPAAAPTAYPVSTPAPKP